MINLSDDFKMYLKIKFNLIERLFFWYKMKSDKSHLLWGYFTDYFDSEGLQMYVKPISRDQWSIYVDNYGHHILTDYVFESSRKNACIAAINIAFGKIKEKESRK